MIGKNISHAEKLPARARRQSIVLAYLNGGLWGIGSGLTGTTLLFYLASSYGAKGIALSWLLAAPALAGVLRLFTPLWLDRVGSRRIFCIRMFGLSAFALLGLPVLSAPNILPEATQSIAALTACWATYNLFEHFAVVALWSWIGDLIPQQIRGRFVGRRLSWVNGGKVLGISTSAIFAIAWRKHCETTGNPDGIWIGFAALAITGASFMLLAIWPLAKIFDPPSPSGIGSRSPRERLREILIPFADASFRRLLYYGLWFSFANGIADTAARVYLVSILKIKYTEKRILDSTSRGIQSLAMPWVGRQVDRHGNVPALVVSQGFVSVALLFLVIATPETKWWIIGAYICWIAYAGTNVARPNLMLRLSAPEFSGAYAAAWFASTQLAYALSALSGGLWFDWMSENWKPFELGPWQVDHFAAILLIGCLLRAIGMLWAAHIRED